MVTGYIKDEYGREVCPVEVCKAVCCRAQHFRPDKNPPCEYLLSDFMCELHKVGGLACKPKGCGDYPRSQADIDGVNEAAKRAGLTERCSLRFD